MQMHQRELRDVLSYLPGHANPLMGSVACRAFGAPLLLFWQSVFVKRPGVVPTLDVLGEVR
jgi:hypothetical protein